MLLVRFCGEYEFSCVTRTGWSRVGISSHTRDSRGSLVRRCLTIRDNPLPRVVRQCQTIGSLGIQDWARRLKILCEKRHLP